MDPKATIKNHTRVIPKKQTKEVKWNNVCVIKMHKKKKYWHKTDKTHRKPITK